VAKRLRARPQEFTVSSDETVRVDMSIIIGFRSGAGYSLDRKKTCMPG
jgi:hypothetical protein